MSDFFGSMLKGIQPIMDVVGIPKDESFHLITKQSEVRELKGKIDLLYEKVGRTLYEQKQQGLLNTNTPEYDSAFREIDELIQVLQLREAELKNLKDIMEEKENNKNRAVAERTCQNCEFENVEGTKFCQECGGKLGSEDPVFCPDCGEKIALDVKFCGSCGRKI